MPPGTSIFAFALCKMGVVAAAALSGPPEGVADDEPEGRAAASPVEAGADGEGAAEFCAAGFCVGADAGAAGGNGPSCWARAGNANPRNAITTAPANCRRSEPFLMYCPPPLLTIQMMPPGLSGMYRSIPLIKPAFPALMLRIDRRRMYDYDTLSPALSLCQIY